MCLKTSKEFQMADRDEILRTHTFKDEGFPVAQRVFYTLNPDDKDLLPDRKARALALLIEHLHEKGILDDQELDELLIKAAYQ
jgi:hypothetical protein